MQDKAFTKDHLPSKFSALNMGRVSIARYQKAYADPFSGKGRFFFIWVVVVLSVLFSAHSTSHAEEKAPLHTLIGKITYDSKEPVYPLTVNIFEEKGQFPNQPAQKLQTDRNGIFSMSWHEKDTLVLQISGYQGSGRVLVTPENRADTLRLRYPVIEEIVLLHNNDVHFDINHPELFLQKLNEFRHQHENVFLLSAGDIFVRHAHRWKVNGLLMEDISWYARRTMEMIENMNTMQYDAMTLGNHEFDYKENYTRQALEKANFPLLAANIHFTDRILPSVKETITLKTSTWREIGVLGLSVGVKKEGIERNDIFKTSQKYAWMADETDVFVALTHIGLKNDKALAKALPALDIIIGGHTHDLLVESIVVNDVMIAMAGGNPHEVSDDHPVYLGIITIELVNGKITNRTGKVIRIDPL